MAKITIVIEAEAYTEFEDLVMRARSEIYNGNRAGGIGAYSFTVEGDLLLDDFDEEGGEDKESADATAGQEV